MCIKARTEAKHYQPRRYFAAAPTRDQAKKIYWDDLKDLTRLWWLERPRETDLIIYVRGAYGRTDAEIHVLGMDKPERIEGQPWDGGVLDEYGNMKEKAWFEHVRPALSDRQGWCWLIGVPEGRNHYYDLALDAAGGVLPKAVPGEGISRFNLPEQFGYFHWFSADILPEHEIENARRHLDERTFNQEYEGSFEAYYGLAYWAFGEHNLAKVEYDPHDYVHTGMDFNVNPMTATLGHIDKNEVYRQFGEVYLPNSNTYEMRDHLLERFQRRQVIIYPDSTGKRETSNARQSDLAILQGAGFVVKARESNPLQKDRVATVNSMCRAAAGNVRYFVNPETCHYTIRDMQLRERYDDGRLDKDQEERGIGHIDAALGYLMYYNWPITSVMAGGSATMFGKRRRQ